MLDGNFSNNLNADGNRDIDGNRYGGETCNCPSNPAMSVSAAPCADFPENIDLVIYCLSDIICHVGLNPLTVNVVSKVCMRHHKNRDVSQTAQNIFG